MTNNRVHEGKKATFHHLFPDLTYPAFWLELLPYEGVREVASQPDDVALADIPPYYCAAPAAF